MADQTLKSLNIPEVLAQAAEVHSIGTITGSHLGIVTDHNPEPSVVFIGDKGRALVTLKNVHKIMDLTPSRLSLARLKPDMLEYLNENRDAMETSIDPLWTKPRNEFKTKMIVVRGS